MICMSLFDRIIHKKEKEPAGGGGVAETALSPEKQRPSCEISWPPMQPVNGIRVKTDADAGKPVIPESVLISEKRRGEIGTLIDGSPIDTETLRFLSMQELLLLVAYLEKADTDTLHRTGDGEEDGDPVPGEEYLRILRNEVISRIRKAEKLYCLYDVSTAYPFLDNGCALVYLDKETAEYAVKLYAAQNRRLVIQECPGEGSQEGKGRGTFFDLMYMIGADRLIIDNGCYNMHFERTEIVADPGDWGAKKDPMPVNGALVSAMLEFLQELKWQVGYEQRALVLRAREAKMLGCIRKASFIIPARHDGPAEVLDGGMLKAGPDMKVYFPMLKGDNGEDVLPVYTDMGEFSRRFGSGDWMAGVFNFRTLFSYVADKSGFIINPDGERIIITSDRLRSMEGSTQDDNVVK